VAADGKIAGDDKRKPGVQPLLGRHLEFLLAQIPVEHSFALDSDRLLDLAPAAGCSCRNFRRWRGGFPV
jgi:hypothetical protein